MLIDISGTLAERYLHEHRGLEVSDVIKDLLDVRYHDGVYSSINQAILPAMVLVARGKHQKVQAIQTIYLDRETGNKADVRVVKETWGVTHGAAVTLQGKQCTNDVNLFVEGPEDGIVIFAATKNMPVTITLSQSNFLSAIQHADAIEKIVCLDNDGGHDKVINSPTFKKLHEQTDVWFALPPLNEDAKKTDYNDVYKAKGTEAIVPIIEAAQKGDDFSKSDREVSCLGNLIRFQAQDIMEQSGIVNSATAFDSNIKPELLEPSFDELVKSYEQELYQAQELDVNSTINHKDRMSPNKNFEMEK